MIKIYGNNLTDKGGKMIIIELIISFQLMNRTKYFVICVGLQSPSKNKSFFFFEKQFVLQSTRFICYG